MINKQKIKKIIKERRHNRQRAKISGTKPCPRFSVFRSNKHISCQLINDDEGKTLVSANDIEIKNKKTKNKKSEIAFMVGGLIAEKAAKKEIKKVVFDKGCYKYHGRVKSIAEGARKGGLQF